LEIYFSRFFLFKEDDEDSKEEDEDDEHLHHISGFFFIFNKKYIFKNKNMYFLIKKREKRCICAFKGDKGPKREKIKIKDQSVTNK